MIPITAFIATTRMTVLRGVTTDAYGDEVDTTTQVATGLPAAISPAKSARSFAHGDQHAFHPAEGRTGVVERFVIRLRPDAQVRELDRLLDARSGLTYQVTDVSTPQGIAGMADVRVTAIRVGPYSLPVNG